jgi:hypothetical protein
MTALPPHRNNNNNNNHGTNIAAIKEAPYDGQSRRQRTNDGTMDMMGDMQEAPFVAAMFMVGVLTWFLRERCFC